MRGPLGGYLIGGGGLSNSHLVNFSKRGLSNRGLSSRGGAIYQILRYSLIRRKHAEISSKPSKTGCPSSRLFRWPVDIHLVFLADTRSQYAVDYGIRLL